MINADHVAHALAALQRTLNTPYSPLDHWRVGDEGAMSEQQRHGMKLFADNGCVACHRGPAMTDSNFHRIQVPGSEDEGRYRVTEEESDRFAFKTPTLRNVALTPLHEQWGDRHAGRGDPHHGAGDAGYGVQR